MSCNRRCKRDFFYSRRRWRWLGPIGDQYFNSVAWEANHSDRPGRRWRWLRSIRNRTSEIVRSYRCGLRSRHKAEGQQTGEQGQTHSFFKKHSFLLGCGPMKSRTRSARECELKRIRGKREVGQNIALDTDQVLQFDWVLEPKRAALSRQSLLFRGRSIALRWQLQQHESKHRIS